MARYVVPSPPIACLAISRQDCIIHIAQRLFANSNELSATFRMGKMFKNSNGFKPLWRRRPDSWKTKKTIEMKNRVNRTGRFYGASFNPFKNWDNSNRVGSSQQELGEKVDESVLFIDDNASEDTLNYSSQIFLKGVCFYRDEWTKHAETCLETL